MSEEDIWNDTKNNIALEETRDGIEKDIEIKGMSIGSSRHSESTKSIRTLPRSSKGRLDLAKRYISLESDKNNFEFAQEKLLMLKRRLGAVEEEMQIAEQNFMSRQNESNLKMESTFDELSVVRSKIESYRQQLEEQKSEANEVYTRIKAFEQENKATLLEKEKLIGRTEQDRDLISTYFVKHRKLDDQLRITSEELVRVESEKSELESNILEMQKHQIELDENSTNLMSRIKALESKQEVLNIELNCKKESEKITQKSKEESEVKILELEDRLERNTQELEKSLEDSKRIQKKYEKTKNQYNTILDQEKSASKNLEQARDQLCHLDEQLIIAQNRVRHSEQSLLNDQNNFANEEASLKKCIDFHAELDSVHGRFLSSQQQLYDRLKDTSSLNNMLESIDNMILDGRTLLNNL